MGKLLDLKISFDHRCMQLLNVWKGRELYSLSAEQKKLLKRTKEHFNKKLTSTKVLVCGNGPSINELDFSLFHSTDVVAANYFYKHEKAAELNPKFYVIIDSKIASGVWPITMIDEIFEKLPKTNLFLDVRWAILSKFSPYLSHPNIFWIFPSLLPHAFLKPRTEIDKNLCSLNVVSCSISLITALGYKKIGIAGVDGDGLFREIINVSSHFYEGQKDISMNSFQDMVKSLFLSAENLWAWQGIVKTHKEAQIHIYNVCTSGIMDCMERISPEKFISIK